MTYKEKQRIADFLRREKTLTKQITVSQNQLNELKRECPHPNAIECTVTPEDEYGKVYLQLYINNHCNDCGLVWSTDTIK